MTLYKPSLGDIVALSSHPFNELAKEITIIGEHLHTSPLMVVAEIITDSKDQFDEKNGMEISRVGLSQCKCLWFSNKTNQFEDVWLSSKFLKLIERQSEISKENLSFDIPMPSTPSKTTKKYYNVVFKTNILELGKKKSSIIFDETSSSSSSDEKYSTNSYLAFVSPVMEILQVIDGKEIDQKDGKHNSKTGDQRKFGAAWFVKCKWYNAASEKFSEKILPLDVLEIITPIEDAILKEIEDKISDGNQYILYKYSHRDINVETLLKPKKLLYKSGIYYLRAYDLLLNKNMSIRIISEKFVFIEGFKIATFPTFDFIKTGIYSDTTVTDELIKAIGQADSKKSFIRIKYQSNEIRSISRTLKNYQFQEVAMPKGKSNLRYLEGYDLTKNEIRTFELKKIRKLEILTLQFEDVPPPKRLSRIMPQPKLK